jgi:hypothetical protein
MSKVEVSAEFLAQVTEYIKVAAEESEKMAGELKTANSKIAELSSSSKTASQAVSLEATTKCAELLVTAGFLSAQHKEAMAKSLQDPAKLADTLQKVAEAHSRRPLGVVEKTASEKTKVTKPSALEEASAKFASAIGAGQ